MSRRDGSDLDRERPMRLQVGEVFAIRIGDGWVRAVLTGFDARWQRGAWFVYPPFLSDDVGLAEPFALPPRGEELVAGIDTVVGLLEAGWIRTSVVVEVPRGAYDIPWEVDQSGGAAGVSCCTTRRGASRTRDRGTSSPRST